MMKNDFSGNVLAWLMGGGLLAAFGASLCCAAPLVLLLLGFSGAWISQLTAFEPFRPHFIAVVLIIYVWTAWLIFRPISQCKADDVCAIPANRRRYKTIFGMFSLLAIALITSPYWLTWMV